MFWEYIVTFDQVYGFYPTLTNMVFSFDVDVTLSTNQGSRPKIGKKDEFFQKSFWLMTQKNLNFRKGL